MAFLAVACGGTNNVEVDSYAKKVAHYAVAKDCNSLKLLGDTILSNGVGDAVVNQLKDTTDIISTATFAVAISPEQAAQLIFDDIKQMSKEDKSQVRGRVRALLTWYKDLGLENNAKKFSESLDALALQLDIEKQAECYVAVASSPSFLAAMVNKDAGENKAELIKAIEKAYSDNQKELTQFRNALKSN